MPNENALSRRAAIAAGAGFTFGAGAAANAQFSLDLGKIGDIGRMLKGLNLKEEDEIEIGEMLFGALVDGMGGLYRNSSTQSSLKNIAVKLFETSAREAFAWDVAVIDNNEVNAWALPGGKVGVNKGLLRYVESEDELAAVIAHEMGHAELSHAAKQMKRKAFYAGLSQASQAAAVSAIDSTEGRAGASVGMKSLEGPMLRLVTSGYSRELETEADMHIVNVFANTGYNIIRGASFYQTLLDLIPEHQKGTTSLFAGHPKTKERLAALREAGADAPETEQSVSHDFFFLKETFPTREIYKRSTG
ncbi:MAG: M48 family metallopeptidase [Marinicaulis sp.]|nr:M48 family metallopeptidase [Marinicaulis sp.]